MSGQRTHLDTVQASKPNRNNWFQNWMLGTIFYRGMKQNVQMVRCASTADKNRAPAPEALAVQRASLAGRLMRSESRGYTIIEVLIVLAISGAILSSSIGVFSGRKGATEFSQAMYDLQSKFQNYANSVSSASLPSGEAYICKVSGLTDGKVYPVLSAAPAGAVDTTNQDCIYLGQAIQIIPGSDTIYNYPVFGLRTVHNGSVDSGDLPSTPAEANPEPALDSSDPDRTKFLLVESYQLLNGLSLVSATAAGSPGEQDLLTFYSSLQNNNTSGSQITASARSYAFGSNDAKSARLRSCIEGSSCGASTENPLIGKSWNLCVQNSTGSKKAQLSIQGTATGITTRLNLETCS